MLSSAIQLTPRPRPPAQVRRTSASQQSEVSPPPPYAPLVFPKSSDLQTNMAASTAAPAIVDNRSSASRPSMSVSEDGFNELSHEELAEILQKADGVIKERTKDLVLASVVARSLHRHSASFQGKHDALFSRIPSPIPSQTHTSPIHPAASLPRGADTQHDSLLSSSSPLSTITPHASVRRIRKISVSPADIALLADQNSELMQKLECLEAESSQADKSGRRKLNRLEKDILALREELERTREKSDALEEQAKNGFGMISVDKKRERVRILRGGNSNMGGDHSEALEEDVRDFAPASVMKASTSSSAYGKRELGDDEAEYQTSSSLMQEEKPSPEYDLISQVLVKIQELEETNRQIALQQAETTTSLTAVQRDAERIGKLYDLLTEHVGPNLQLVVEKDEGTQAISDDGNGSGSSSPEDSGTIRFRSLRKSLEGDLARVMAGGTVRVHTGKARKSVVGYFDHAPEVTAPNQEAGLTSISSFPSGNHSRAQSETLLSPALSSLSMLTPHSDALRQLAQMVSEDGNSLEKELGYGSANATGNVFNTRPRQSHHLRTTSLYRLGVGGEDSIFRDGDTSGVCSPPPSSRTDFLPAAAGNTGDEIRDAEDEGNVEKKSLRYDRMLQTLRLRTTQWADGRFKDSGDDDNKDDVTQQTTAPGFSEVQQPERLDEEKDYLQTGLKSFIFEVWLWLQFVIIILVFVCVVAKKGPKSVLKTDRKRALKRA